MKKKVFVGSASIVLSELPCACGNSSKPGQQQSIKVVGCTDLPDLEFTTIKPKNGGIINDFTLSDPGVYADAY